MQLSCLPVSFFSAISQGEMSAEEWMDFAVELGLDGVECSPVLVQPRGPVTPSEFRRLAEARGLAVSNFTAYTDFPQPDPQARQRELGHALSNLRIAVELGAPSVRVLAGQRWPDVDQAQGIAWVVQAIRTVVDEANRCGVRVVFENHTKAFVWDYFDFAMQGEVFLEILDALRDTSLGVMFDTANPLVANEEAMPFFEKVRDRIGFVHVNDVRRPGAFEFVTVGTGLSPIGEVLSQLRQQGYPGWISIEEASRRGKEGFRESVQFVRQAWEDAARVR